MGSKTAPMIRRAVLEVERKFFSNGSSRERISANQGKPAFHTLEYLGQQSFEDIYFDRDGILMANKIWLRKRSGRWQAKVRHGGDFTNSQFEELSEPPEISALIKRYFLDANVASRNFGLQKIAQFTTVRDAWRADDRFEIVLDDTDFGHSVGEVELQETITITGDDQSLKILQKSMAKEMDRQIDSFMQRYRWAFPVEIPVGKLSAYFAWKNNR